MRNLCDLKVMLCFPVCRCHFECWWCEPWRISGTISRIQTLFDTLEDKKNKNAECGPNKHHRLDMRSMPEPAGTQLIRHLGALRTTCPTHKNHVHTVCWAWGISLGEGKHRPFPPQHLGVGAGTQLKLLRGLRHISLLTNPSHLCGNTLFGFTYIWPLHLRSHIRGLERLTPQIRAAQCEDPFDGQRSDVLDHTCGLSNRRYSAPGGWQTGGADVTVRHGARVCGWSAGRDETSGRTAG